MEPLDRTVTDAWDLLCDLTRQGFHAWIDGETLWVEPRERITGELRQTIRAHKPGLLRLIQEARSLLREQKEDRIVERLETGAEVIFGREQRGETDTPQYEREPALFVVLLCALEMTEPAPLNEERRLFAETMVAT